MSNRWLWMVAAILAGGAAGQARSTPVPGPSPAAQPWYARSHALIIGINAYTTAHPLKYAVNDAKSVADELEADYGFSASDVNTVLDGQATKQAILDALDELGNPQKVGPNDRIVVYFAGHGSTVPSQDPGGPPLGYLIPVDGNAGSGTAYDYNKTCIPMEELWIKLNNSPAKHVVVVLDSCFSGLMVGDQRAYKQEVLDTLLAKRARQAMAAGSSKDLSTEMDDLKHGIFTYSLLKALKDRAGQKQAFTVSDVFPEIRQEVANMTNGGQFPVEGARPGTEGDVVFAPNGCIHNATVPSDTPHIDPNYEEALRANREGRLDDAMRLMEPFAGKGDARALTIVGRGHSYRNELGKAIDYFKRAADAKDPYGEFYYASSIATGVGVARNPDEAAPLLKKALAELQPLAEQKDDWASFLLGRANEEGLGVDQDYVAALRWYRQAAGQGDGVAMSHIAGLYDNGNGVGRDPQGAFDWYSKSAALGMIDSQRRLGIRYENGIGTKQDYAAAMRAYRSAADQGDGDSMIDIALLYERGYGVPKDGEQALHWLLSAGQNHANVAFARTAYTLYCSSDATPEIKKGLLIALQIWRKVFDDMDADGQASALSVFPDEVSALPAGDPALELFDSLVRTYVASFNALSADRRKANLPTWANNVEATLERMRNANDDAGVIAFIGPAIEGINLSECSDGDTANVVRNVGARMNSLFRTGKSKDAKALLKDLLALCDAILEERSWDWYTKDSYRRVCFDAAKALTLLGDSKGAQPLLVRGWQTALSIDGKTELLSKYDPLPLWGEVPKGATGNDAAYFAAMAPGGDKEHRFGMKRFTLGADFDGVQYPFYVYVCHGPNGWNEVSDQFRWVKEIRGGIVAKDAVDSFHKLWTIALENKVDYPDLCVYALGTRPKDDGKNKQSP